MVAYFSQNHHASLTFRVLQDPECDVFSNLNEDQKKEIRRTIIQLVLATDMSNHFEHVSKFRHHVETQPFDRNKKEDRQMILNMLLKCADLSNVAKPWNISENWSNRVADEFFTQADYERSNKYPVAPFMDRFKTTRPRIAADFQDFVALPMFKVLALFLPGTQRLLDYITGNRQSWQVRLDDIAYNTPDVPPIPEEDEEALDPVEDLSAPPPDEEQQEPERDQPNQEENHQNHNHNHSHQNSQNNHHQHEQNAKQVQQPPSISHLPTSTLQVPDNELPETFSSPSGPSPFFRAPEPSPADPAPAPTSTQPPTPTSPTYLQALLKNKASTSSTS